jgi:hypothetical protein
MPDRVADHECLFHPWHVDFARAQAGHAVPQPPLWRACVVCGLWVDLVAVARERLVHQLLHP